jgi:hypothetical protein
MPAALLAWQRLLTKCVNPQGRPASSISPSASHCSRAGPQCKQQRRVALCHPGRGCLGVCAPALGSERRLRRGAFLMPPLGLDHAAASLDAAGCRRAGCSHDGRLVLCRAVRTGGCWVDASAVRRLCCSWTADAARSCKLQAQFGSRIGFSSLKGCGFSQHLGLPAYNHLLQPCCSAAPGCTQFCHQHLGIPAGRTASVELS